MEESFDPIAQTRANYYTPGSPVQFVQVELLKGSVSGDRAVCLTFKNVSQVNLTALEILFKCKGTSGALLCEADFQYKDLDVKPGECFGMDDAVFVTEKPITSVDVVLKSVYHGKKMVQLDKIKRVRLPAPRRLPADLEAALEKRMGRKSLPYAPQVLDNGWYCACGAFHPKEEDTVYCSECGCDRILLQNALNVLMQPAQPEQASQPAEEPTRILGTQTAPARPAEPVADEPTRILGAQSEPVRPAEPLAEGTQAFVLPGQNPPAAPAADEPTRILGAQPEPTRPVEPLAEGTRAFDLSAQSRPAVGEAGATRVVGAEPPVVEEETPAATQAMPWSSRSADRAELRSNPAELMEEEDYEDEEPEDAVADAIIRWVPPLTALICAAIALSGFVYYQFFL